MVVTDKITVTALFPQDLNAYALRLTLYSIALALLTIARLPNQRPLKPILGMGIGITSIVAICARRQNRDSDAVSKLETDAQLGLAADRITAFETIEAERIREKLTIELKNSQSRLSEWE